MHNLNISKETINFQTGCIVKISIGLYNWGMEDLKSTDIRDPQNGYSESKLVQYLSLDPEERKKFWKSAKFCEAFPSIVCVFFSQSEPNPQDAATIIEDFVAFKNDSGAKSKTATGLYDIRTGKSVNSSVANSLRQEERATLEQINFAGIFALSLYLLKNGYDFSPELDELFDKKWGKISDRKILRQIIVKNGAREWIKRSLVRQGNFTIEEWDQFLIKYYLSHYPISEGEPIPNRAQHIPTILTNKDTPDMYSKEILMELVEYANRFTYTYPDSQNENFAILDLMVKILKRHKELSLTEEEIFSINLIILRINPRRRLI